MRIYRRLPCFKRSQTKGKKRFWTSDLKLKLDNTELVLLLGMGCLDQDLFITLDVKMLWVTWVWPWANITAVACSCRFQQHQVDSPWRSATSPVQNTGASLQGGERYASFSEVRKSLKLPFFIFHSYFCHFSLYKQVQHYGYLKNRQQISIFKQHNIFM